MNRRLAFALAGAVVVAGAGAAAAWWRYGSLDGFAGTAFGSDEEKLVEVAPSARPREVARQLEAAGVVSDATRFEWLARRRGRDRQLKVGEYLFAGPLTPEKVLEVLVAGRVKLRHCTVPEGLRLDEAASVLQGCGLGSAPELLRVARDPAFATRLGIPGQTLEGYLFPDTYVFPKNPRPEALLEKMVARARDELAKAQVKRGAAVTLLPHEAMTLASIVEKETAAADERPRISCVFHNRLAKGMRLETDPTVIYAKILRTGSFDGDLTRADLRFPHPYNTYTVKGLPPGPIANPGAAAMEAAWAPLACDDLYFVACGGGRHEFCPDYDCHKLNVARCQAAKP